MDEHTRECIGGLFELFIPADYFIEHLERLIAQRGTPAVVGSDNRFEFIANAITDWVAGRNVIYSTRPALAQRLR